MWSSTISTSVSPRELLENCFLSHSFNQKYHSRCGHVSVEIVAPERVDETHWRLRSIFIVSMVAESTPAMLRSIIGGLDAQVQQETLVEFGGDPLRLHATATSKIASGPGARLNSSAEWDLTGGEVKLLTSVKYQSSGFAERLIASSLEQAASGKARESIELWWVLAQEAVAASRVVASPRQLGNVQRALSFGSELVENRDIGENHSEDDDVMSSVGDEFVDASSMLESPSLRSSSGLLELLQSEAQNLKVEVEALEQRRDQLENRAVALRPSNVMLGLVHWANSGSTKKSVGGGVGSWRAAVAAARCLTAAVRTDWKWTVLPWLLTIAAWVMLRRRQ